MVSIRAVARAIDTYRSERFIALLEMQVSVLFWCYLGIPRSRTLKTSAEF